MIPEEDEERIKTEYESSKKFYEHKNRENINRNSISIRKSITNLNDRMSFNPSQFKSSFTFDNINNKPELNFDSFEKMIQDKLNNNINTNKNLETHIENFPHNNINERNIFSPNKKFKMITDTNDLSSTNHDSNGVNYLSYNNSGVKVKHIRQLSREKSLESISTNEYTNDSAKNRRILNNSEKESNSRMSTPNDIIDFSKLNGKSTNNNIHDEISTHSRKKSANLIVNNKASELSSRPRKIKNDLFNTNDAYNTNSTTKTFSQRSYSNKHRERGNNTPVLDQLTSTTKPHTPPDVSKLPAITTNRRKVKTQDINYDITNIFDAADNFKEDPIIKKKLNDIMQNIVDIRNVLNQKSKARFNIASAPSNLEDTDLNSILNGRNEIRQGVACLPNKDRVKGTFMKIGSANSNLRTNRKLNLHNNNNNNLQLISTTTKTVENFNDKNSLIPRHRDKLPIKLIKKI